ncbi:RNase A-like domain-containing protein, partial [Mycolicibacterium sp.]|uniref:RNase A-like domain-containing protein n=1 Tax=Mycolicibacterium sp. TaxID=2320850 RepID=UPI0037C87DE4
VADAAKELKDEADKWWTAEQTVQSQITALRGKLDGAIPPAGAAPPGSPLTMVGPFAVPPEVAAAAQQLPGQPVPGQNPAGQAPPGQVGPFPVPPAVAAAVNGPGGAPITKLAGDDSGLGGLLGADDSLEGAPAAGQQGGLPAALSQLPAPPQPGAVDRQAAKVEAARQNLVDAQAKANDAANANVVLGPGAGPSPDAAHDLGQAVFDARAELTEQTRILNELNYASAASGGPTVPVPALPENAHLQAFPPEPSAFAEGSRALSEGSFGLIPDVAKDIETFTNWDQASGADRAQAALDAAGMVPLPGAKFLTEGVEHGLDAAGAVARHFDDAPTPHADVDPPAAPHTGDHTSPDAPVEHHGSPDSPVEHHAGGDTGHVAPYGVEETSALLAASENAGGHLIERHVGQTFDDLSARLAASPRLGEVSTFTSVDEAATAVTTVLQHNRMALDTWVADGAQKTLVITAPFDGGEVLVRGGVESVPGSTVKVVLKGDGMGNWNILTGYVLP